MGNIEHNRPVGMVKNCHKNFKDPVGERLKQILNNNSVDWIMMARDIIQSSKELSNCIKGEESVG
jgi:hypothetical protein